MKAPLQKRISGSRDPQSKTSHPTDPSRAPFKAPFEAQGEQGEQGRPFDSSRASQGKQGKSVGHPKRQISPKIGGAEFRAKADPSLVRRADSLVMRNIIFGSSESVAAETENSCHVIRSNGSWDVGRFGRVIFFARINNAAPPAHARQLASQFHSESDVYLFYRECQTLKNWAAG